MINRAWHEANQLGPKASLEQRIAWHAEHAKVCNCREMPDAIRKILAERGIDPPGKPAER